ncbi:hypothetical protein [Pedobacter hartonius]|uniref:Outer membrane protein beta-barrel domain-containing protein n=1 Tax=Pedobacter hartonius TaxID=425514 RepID=A0A1H4H3N7_9SPHI|nr:hypothetical protein [Pedobacter hartonius]SEB16346.1 hypothetical protein SAMN05443550_11332 [Pedobacter hartonius]
MNKILLPFMVFICVFNLKLTAQRSAFRSGYIRIGINKIGDGLDQQLSPKQNVFDGRYGAGTGYVFETGHIFYFGKKSAENQPVNFGLDWTYISLNYNKMDEWEDYGRAAGATEIDVSGTKTAAAISSKLGPVISFNPIGKLVIDARFQVAPVLRFFDLDYSQNYGEPNQQSFTFVNYQKEEMDDSFEAESFKNRIAFGLATSFGITIRRKAIGFAIDYVSGKVNSYYEATEGSLGSSAGKEKIPVHNLQFKLSLSL